MWRSSLSTKNTLNPRLKSLAEVESRTQPSRPRPKTRKNSEAKDQHFDDRPSRGQGQEWLRPRIEAEVESRTQGSRPRPRTQKKSEAKAKAKDSLSEDRHSRGQGQECSRPRPRTKDTKRKCSPKKKKKKVFTKIFQAISKKKKKKKKVFTKIFQAISTKKRFPKNFSTASQNFNFPKNSAVLEPRTGQFSRT